MARTLPLRLKAAVGAPEARLPSFEVEICPQTITVRGHLSTGSRGWALRAEAACRRSTINLHVTAIEVGEERVPDLEHHRYEATLKVRHPGRYSLRISHGFVMRGEVGLGLPRPVFEKTLQVP
ncbi:MAG: hypothetical protein AB7R55_03070 [Gemmatimonadales bacterium]